MTNREKLLEELNQLDSAQLYGILADNRLVTLMEDYQCMDCETLHRSPCPILDDDCESCRLSTVAWLDLPCKVERLIPEGGYGYGT